MSGLRIIFAGTPDFAAAHLQTLIDSEHQVIAVYSQPDRPAGRGKQLQASPVKQRAEAADIAVYQPVSLKGDEAQQQLAALNADIMVVVAYGLLLPKAVLEIPRLGCINVHGSLLPRWRGAAPIQRAIEAGDTESGVTIMQMDVGLDTGDMLVKAHCPVAPLETGGELHDKLQSLGQDALLEALSQLASGTATPEPQDDGLSNYAPKFSKPEMLIDWQQPAGDVFNKIRAFIPFPVASTQSAGEKVRIWAAQPSDANSPSHAAPGTILEASEHGLLVACGEGSLLLTRLQIPGKKAMPVSDILRARAERFAPGTQLGQVAEPS